MMHDKQVVLTVVRVMAVVVLVGFIANGLLDYFGIEGRTIGNLTSTALGSLVTLLTSVRTGTHEDPIPTEVVNRRSDPVPVESAPKKERD